jgi:hypothetical protein
MGENKRIVIEHFPVDRLPEELRQGLESGKLVRVTVEGGGNEAISDTKRLRAFLGAASGRYTDPQDIVTEIRQTRDDWDEH